MTQDERKFVGIRPAAKPGNPIAPMVPFTEHLRRWSRPLERCHTRSANFDDHLDLSPFPSHRKVSSIRSDRALVTNDQAVHADLRFGTTTLRRRSGLSAALLNTSLMALARFCMDTTVAMATKLINNAYSTRSFPDSSRQRREMRLFTISSRLISAPAPSVRLHPTGPDLRTHFSERGREVATGIRRRCRTQH
jgi:hypothetical protein